jgi:hypothetical protein
VTLAKSIPAVGNEATSRVDSGQPLLPPPQRSDLPGRLTVGGFRRTV